MTTINDDKFYDVVFVVDVCCPLWIISPHSRPNIIRYYAKNSTNHDGL